MNMRVETIADPIPGDRLDDQGQMTMPARKFTCQVCGHVYDEAQGDPAAGIAPGTRWEDLPDDWTCPDCGVRKADFCLAAAA